MKKLIFLSIVAGLFTFSCKDTENKTKDAGSNSKYKIESAIIEYQMDMMSMTAKATLYFKEYGEVQCVEAEMEMMGVKSVNRTLEKEGYTYNLNMEQKSGSKVKTSEESREFDPNDFNFDNLSKEIVEKYKIVEEGNEEVAGKTCKVFSMNIEGQDAKFYVWENIPVKYEMSQNNMTMVMKAVKIEVGSDFPKGIFDVPADFTIEGTTEEPTN